MFEKGYKPEVPHNHVHAIKCTPFLLTCTNVWNKKKVVLVHFKHCLNYDFLTLPSLRSFRSAIQLNDLLVIFDQLLKLVHIEIDILFHPFLHRVWEIDVPHMNVQVLD